LSALLRETGMWISTSGKVAANGLKLPLD